MLIEVFYAGRASFVKSLFVIKAHMAGKAAEDRDVEDVPLIVRRKSPRDDFPTAHLAQIVGRLLADGRPRTPKEIARAISQQQQSPINESGVNKSLDYGAQFFDFKKLPRNRWTVDPRLIPKK